MRIPFLSRPKKHKAVLTITSIGEMVTVSAKFRPQADTVEPSPAAKHAIKALAVIADDLADPLAQINDMDEFTWDE